MMIKTVILRYKKGGRCIIRASSIRSIELIPDATRPELQIRCSGDLYRVVHFTNMKKAISVCEDLHNYVFGTDSDTNPHVIELE